MGSNTNKVRPGHPDVKGATVKGTAVRGTAVKGTAVKGMALKGTARSANNCFPGCL